MTGKTCDWVRDSLPEFAGGSLGPGETSQVESHLDSCRECREELGTLRLVREAPDASIRVPPGLEESIRARLRRELSLEAAGASDPRTRPARGNVVPIFGGRLRAPVWALSAAAVGILALGTAVIYNERGQDLAQDPVVVAAQDPVPEAWLMDDGIVAGAPMFDGLSDEDLEALLEEFEG